MLLAAAVVGPYAKHIHSLKITSEQTGGQAGRKQVEGIGLMLAGNGYSIGKFYKICTTLYMQQRERNPNE